MQTEDTRQWSQLYATASTGKIKTWQTWVTKADDGTAIIYTKHGYIDGKLQTKPKIIKVGKNIGKSNETTPFEQACAQAASAHQKKLAKKYITEIPNSENTPEIYLPMLAKDYKKCSHNINFPVLLQPKLNGVRCLAKKTSEWAIDFTSKGGKSYNAVLGHLVNDLLSIMKVGEIFDGEIFVYGWSLQQIVRRVKKLRKDSHLLQYWIYDVADDQFPTTWRNDRYINAIGNMETPTPLVAVHTEAANDEEMIYDFHKRMITAGFEGTIIRNINANYQFDHRSMNLQKLKDYQDAEFKIVGYETETVTNTDHTISKAIIFTCQTANGKEFNVRPRGTVEQRIRWYNDFENIIDKNLTIRYFELSDDQIPLQPVGLSIRDYE